MDRRRLRAPISVPSCAAVGEAAVHAPLRRLQLAQLAALRGAGRPSLSAAHARCGRRPHGRCSPPAHLGRERATRRRNIQQVRALPGNECERAPVDGPRAGTQRRRRRSRAHGWPLRPRGRVRGRAVLARRPRVARARRGHEHGHTRPLHQLVVGSEELERARRRRTGRLRAGVRRLPTRARAYAVERGGREPLYLQHARPRARRQPFVRAPGGGAARRDDQVCRQALLNCRLGVAVAAAATQLAALRRPRHLGREGGGSQQRCRQLQSLRVHAGRSGHAAGRRRERRSKRLLARRRLVRGVMHLHLLEVQPARRPRCAQRVPRFLHASAEHQPHVRGGVRAEREAAQGTR